MSHLVQSNRTIRVGRPLPGGRAERDARADDDQPARLAPASAPPHLGQP
ncbi:MAG: hypothetical protein MUD01_24090 [Chloroflexaceae bacterium]|nr:hypothetical protein [Chloroflexaceae bacterium]